MRLIGQTTEGFYLQDELEGVHEDLIQRYYGVEGMPTAPVEGRTGAGFNSEEDALGDDSKFDYDSSEEDEPMSSRYKRVKPKTRAQCPFKSSTEKALFTQALDEALTNGGLPPDVALGWNWDPYAQLKIGRRRLAQTVQLPEAIWRDRAIVWAKALRVMVHLTNRLGTMDVDE